MLKRIRIISSVFAVVSVVQFCGAAYGLETSYDTEYDTGETDQDSLYEFGWDKELRSLRYKNSSDEYLTGWQYLPVPGYAGKKEWFFFNKDGCLLTSFKPEVLTVRPESVYCSSGITGITHNIRPYNSYDHIVLEQGWYDLSSVGDGDAESAFFTEPLYIKNVGNDEYSICRFSNGDCLALDSGIVKGQGDSLSFLMYEGKDSQKWSIIKNDDDSVSFISNDKGLVLDKQGEVFTLSLYEEGKNTQKVKTGERLPARPEYYGAAGDGISDDTSAIRYAVNNNPLTVFSGRYNTSERISVDFNGATLRGEGGVFITHPEFQIFRVGDRNITFDGLNFRGNYSTEESTTNSCIFVETLRGDEPVVDFNTTVKNCSFIETGLRGVHIHSERVSESDYTPLSVASNITIRDCAFDTYKIGVCCSGPDNVTVEGCSFRNAFYEHVTFDWRTRYSTVKNCYFEGPEGGVGCIGLDTAEDCVIRDSTFYYSQLYGITFNNDAGPSRNITIEGNRFEYAGGNGGVLFAKKGSHGVAAENVTILNNTFDTYGSDSVLVLSAEGSLIFNGNDYNGKTALIKTEDAVVNKDY